MEKYLKTTLVKNCHSNAEEKLRDAPNEIKNIYLGDELPVSFDCVPELLQQLLEMNKVDSLADVHAVGNKGYF